MKEDQCDFAAILEDLKNPDATIRKTAVEECCLLGVSNEVITKVLAEMAAADEDKIVAASAHQALDSPAQQVVLEEHPELKLEEPQESQEIPKPATNSKKVLMMGTILGVLSAGIFVLPISLVKTSLLWHGITWGLEYSGDNPGVFCSLNIVGSALFGLLATCWDIRLGLTRKETRGGDSWEGLFSPCCSYSFISRSE